MYTRVGDISIEVVAGNIADQPDIDAVVNAANAQLMPGGGVAGAIHRAAVPGLARECKPLGPIRPGEAVITGAHDLPNQHVIHCLGPIYGRDEPSDRLLADCYRNALRLADQHKLASIAFPSISTGAFGYPMAVAAEVAFLSVRSILPELLNLQLIRFVLFVDEALQIHCRVFRNIFPEQQTNPE